LVEVVSTDIIALVFDFDDTLAPDSTTKFLRHHKINTTTFWQKDVKNLVERGFDQPTAYLRLILDQVNPRGKLRGLTNASLRQFGGSLDTDFYPGLPKFFDEMRTQVVRDSKQIQIEFYIISGGLCEMIRGSKIVQKYFNGVYGCHLSGDTEDGPLKYIKRSVTFTEKTRYLFEVNKGLKQEDTWRNPILVNQSIPPEERRIPFRNMIYVGDGLTDIPCFSLLKVNQGLGFGVFNPKSDKNTKQALEEFLQTDRVVSMHSPDYRKRSELGSILRAAVASRCAQIQLERAQPRRERVQSR
jgi:hypothetical protein